MNADQAATNPQAHWEEVYRTKDEAQLSWHQDEPATSLQLICEFAGFDHHVIDIGGGSSALAGRLVARGYRNVSVLDIAAAAIEKAKHRSGMAAAQINWLVGDVTDMPGVGPVDLWHDRAVFHFLTQSSQRARYAETLRTALRVGGHAVMATFSPAGPAQCSGLPVVRYDADSLARELGPGLALVKSQHEQHLTPWGKAQAFMFAVLRRVDEVPRLSKA
jgi:ubiquinone/menaquinone biosynthesis C-methylase UbiE